MLFLADVVGIAQIGLPQGSYKHFLDGKNCSMSDDLMVALKN